MIPEGAERSPGLPGARAARRARLGALVGFASSWLVAATGPALAQHAAPRTIPHEEAAPLVEVLTFGPGEEIFERWGHTAICLRFHRTEHAPVCFDYGVTEFDDGATLAWSSVRGEQLFWVEPSPRDTQLALYLEEDRDIWSQALPFSETQARVIEARLWGDIDERRRYYVYDHLHDNCSTRIRDVVDEATGGALRRSTRGAHPLSYRQLGQRGLVGLAPMLALTDFVLGRELDEHPTYWQAMFQPDVLRRQLQLRLGVAPRVEHARRQPPFPTDGPSGRLPALALALALAVALLAATRRRRLERTARWAAALYLGTWGLIVLGLVLLSPIAGVRWNEAALVVVPLDLALPWLSPTRRARYAGIRVAGLLVVAVLWAAGVLHQPLWLPILTAALPLSAVALAPRLQRREPGATPPSGARDPRRRRPA